MAWLPQALTDAKPSQMNRLHIKDNGRMLVNYPHPWRTRVVTFFLAATAAASLAFWSLKWPVSARTDRVATPELAPATIDSAKLAQLLGLSASGPGTLAPLANAASRYKLIGVIAQGSQRGSALIAIDGEPAKPFRVGALVTDGMLLQSVHGRSVTLAPEMTGNQGVTLEMPPLPGAP
jgi:general secretion pathway protein C